MTKAVYVGAADKAHRVKAIYVGIDGKARKVKKGYIGVGGIARLFYAAEAIVTVSQSDHQTISVMCNGATYTESFIAPIGSSWTATITAEAGYNVGTLTTSSGVITGDITISATAAVIKTYLVTINQPANGSITASYNGITYNANFTVPHGANVTFTCTPNSGYKFTSFSVT